MMITGANVLLTGGSRGLGPHIAEALATRGANVALAARSRAGLEKVAEAVRGHGVQAVAIPTDLAEEAGCTEAVRRVREELGEVDILVHNAGLETEGAFVKVPWDEVRATVEVNLMAPLRLTHLLLPGMVERGRGHVVVISSLGGLAGTPYDAVYCGTKAALAHWARGLRLELSGTGVAVSTIYPGYVTGTGMFARFGVKAPWAIGSCTPSQVVSAVVDAVERGRKERIVNSRPLRPALALADLSPGLGERMMRWLGVVDFQRRKVGERA